MKVTREFHIESAGIPHNSVVTLRHGKVDVGLEFEFQILVVSESG